jgi:hypothetical protein
MAEVLTAGAPPARIGSGTMENLYSVWGSSATDIWAVGGMSYFPATGGKIQHWDGQRWTGVPSATDTWTLHAVWGSGPADVWAGGEGGMEHWDGTAWSQWAFPTGSSILGIWGAAANDVWAVGTGTGVYHFDGTTWTASAVGTIGTPNLDDVWGAARDDVWAVGGTDAYGNTSGKDTSAIIHYDGNAWSYMASTVEHRFHAVHGTARDDVWLVGRAGYAAHWNGTAWTAVTVPTSNELFSARARSRTDVFIAADLGQVLHLAGGTWTAHDTLSGDGITDLWSPGGATGDLFGVGAEGMILRRNGP